ncbi:MAG: homoserine dehydrogenase [Candidatus Tectomicrobia bacterium]|uniref:Homoserine dehydrogenase n=1 Tax=Tectimicrobiota bacterium TaxID=2528274 RepID=A0A932GMT2_UNCTE|nr:homoserine dehydrogenase [Candidatus Tectomicrobia bacterium]
MDAIHVGILGFGTVGTGTAQILLENKDLILQRLGVPVCLAKVADRDLERKRNYPLPDGVFTTRVEDVLEDPSIHIVVELIGGLEPALSFIRRAIAGGKHVVTANKALLAHAGAQLFGEAAARGVEIGFEASVGGGIPIIRALKEGFAANQIQSIYSIINGTGNYILSRMTNEGRKFADVLKEAQEKGYAEKDPTLDVEGIDSAHKIAILASLAFGVTVPLESVYTEGITHIDPLDIQFAREFGFKIKLLAIAKNHGDQIEVRVHPTMLPSESPIAKVDGVFNAIQVEGDWVGKNMFIGRGAGALPTGSAVVGDIVDISRSLLKRACGRVSPLSTLPRYVRPARVKAMESISSEFYLRCSALDKPGVMAKISGVLGRHGISIASVIQKGRHEERAVPVVFVTHSAREQDVRDALGEIDRLEVVTEKTMLVRLESSV